MTAVETGVPRKKERRRVALQINVKVEQNLSR